MHLAQRAAFGPENPDGQDIKDPFVVLKAQGIVGSVAVTGVAQKIDNTAQDVRYIIDDEQRLSELAVPIIAKNGKVIGVIDTAHPERNYYPQQHVDVLTTIASITATKIMQADAQNALQKHQDHLEELVRKRTSEIEDVIEELRKSDKEKSVLLTEIHHRVKKPHASH